MSVKQPEPSSLAAGLRGYRRSRATNLARGCLGGWRRRDGGKKSPVKSVVDTVFRADIISMFPPAASRWTRDLSVADRRRIAGGSRRKGDRDGSVFTAACWTSRPSVATVIASIDRHTRPVGGHRERIDRCSACRPRCRGRTVSRRGSRKRVGRRDRPTLLYRIVD